MSEEINKIIENHEKRISQLESLFNSDKKEVLKKISIKEFLIQKNPKSDIQKTLAICYYLEKFDRMELFNTKDIEMGFLAAKEQAPKNTNLMVIRNIQKGFLMESKEKKDNLKSWILTSTGEKYVEEWTNP